MSRQFSLFAALLMFPFCTFAQKGYEVVLRTTDTVSRNYALSGYKWGEKKGIDTVAGAGKIVFSGAAAAMPPGQYLIEELGERKERLSFQFLVDAQKAAVRLQYTAAPIGIALSKGDEQNREYLRLQEFLRKEALKVKNLEELNRILADFLSRVQAKSPGSMLEYVLKGINGVFKTPEEMLQAIPYSNPVLLNSVFGKEQINRYLKAIELNPTDTLIRFTDRLIEMAGKRGGEALQQRVAGSVFEYFRPGSIMGQEAVAVHTAENWFLNDKIPLSDPDNRFLMKTFTELNKHSLVGMPAPELNLIDTVGAPVALSSLQGEYTILYFYTDDCVTCRIETPRLMNFVNGYKDGVLNVYAVYAQAGTGKWKEYIGKEFKLYNPFINWTDVYDPEFESGFHLLYNVLSTPQMFLLDKNGTILGRNLKTKQLEELLTVKNRERDDLHKFFNNFFTKLGELDTTTVQMGIDAFYTRSAQNPALFREIFGELYNFLRLSPDYLLQNGAIYLAQNYILEKPELWNNPVLIGRIREALRVFNLNPLGKPATDLTLEQINGSPINLSDIRTKYKVLYFYKPDCGTCSVVTPQLGKLYRELTEQPHPDIEFIAINLGTDRIAWLKYVAENDFGWLDAWGGTDNRELFEKYYLNGVPVIYLLRNNIVIAKDITDIDLKEILQKINTEEL